MDRGRRCVRLRPAARSAAPYPSRGIGGSSPPAAQALSSPGVAANLAGVWCFRATYTPTGSTYLGSSDATARGVRDGQPGSDDDGDDAALGRQPDHRAVGRRTRSVTDKAVVTGSSADGFPSGTINFFICNPTVVAANGGTLLGRRDGGRQQDAPPRWPERARRSRRPTSDPVQVNSVGTWCFRAEYVPGGVNGANYTGSSDATHRRVLRRAGRDVDRERAGLAPERHRHGDCNGRDGAERDARVHAVRDGQLHGDAGSRPVLLVPRS